MDQQLTLPGVMQFLRTEWLKHERQNIEWEMEKAQMLSQIAKLESETQKLTTERNDLRQQVHILNPSQNYEPTDPQISLQAVNNSKEIVNQCITDIKSILKESGVEGLDFNPNDHSLTTFSPKSCETFSNFVSKPTSITPLDDKIILALENGQLLQLNHEGHQVVDTFTSAIQHVFVFQSHLVAVCQDLVRFYDQGLSISKEHRFSSIKSVKCGSMVAVETDSDIHLVNKNLEVAAVPLKPLFDALGNSEIQDYSINENLVVAFNGVSTGTLAVINPESHTVERRLSFQLPSKLSVFDVYLDLVVLATENGDLQVMNLSKGEVQTEFTNAHRSEIEFVRIINSELLLTASKDGKISLWTLPALLWKSRMYSHDCAFGIADIKNSRSRVCVAGNDYVVRVYTV